MNIMRKATASVALTGSLLLAGGALAGPAQAQVQLNNLIAVQINNNDVAVSDVADVVVQAAINACDVIDANVPVAVLGTVIAVDRSGRERTVCTNGGQTVTLENVGPRQ